MRPLLIVLLSLLAGSVRADAGLDLVVAVDRSGSMERIPDDVLELPIDLLARDGAAVRLVHRLGAISFGSHARVDLALTPVRRETAAALRHTVEAIPSETNLGDTDFVAALTSARRLFDRVTFDPARRRAILLVTDGLPDLPGSDATDTARHLRRYVQKALSDVALEIAIVPSRSSARRDDALWRGIARGRTTTVRDTREQLLAAVHRMVSHVSGTRSIEIHESVDALVVPPYLQLVVFDVVAARGSSSMLIFAPGADRPLSAKDDSVEEVRNGEMLWTMAVRRPAAGRWRFRKSSADARVTIFSQQFFPRGELVTPAPEIPPVRSTVIAYRLVDTGGTVLAELPGYPLTLELSLVHPGGRRAAYRMDRTRAAGSSIYRSRGTATCTLAGRYATEVAVRTTDAEGRGVDVFRDSWSGFSVASGHTSAEGGGTLAGAAAARRTRGSPALSRSPRP
jgi:Mg-chelatase subunit ChlD